MTKTAVVTGASSGIGAATARALADDGWHVICAARRVERIEPLSAEIGGQAVVCDVTSDESVTNLVKTVGGKVDLLVNNVVAPSVKNPSLRLTSMPGRRCTKPTC